MLFVAALHGTQAWVRPSGEIEGAQDERVETTLWRMTGK